MELLQDFVIPLEYLDGVPSLLFFGHIVHSGLFDMCQRMLDRTGEAVLRDGLCALRRGDGCFCRIHDTVALESGDHDDFAAELAGEFFHADLIAVFLHDIHHVDGHNHRNTQFCQLGRQVEVSLQVRTVYDVQDRIRTLTDQVVSGYHFFQCIRRQGINTRQVRNDHVVVLLQFTFFLFNGYARPVTHKLICAGQRIEKRCLTTIRVTCKCNTQTHFSSSFL